MGHPVTDRFALPNFRLLALFVGVLEELFGFHGLIGFEQDLQVGENHGPAASDAECHLGAGL